LSVRSTVTESIAVTLVRQERSPQPPRQEAQFRLRPDAIFRHQKTKCKLIFGSTNLNKNLLKNIHRNFNSLLYCGVRSENRVQLFHSFISKSVKWHCFRS